MSQVQETSMSRFMLVSCLAYSLPLKMEATCLSKTLTDLNRLRGIISQKIKAFSCMFFHTLLLHVQGPDLIIAKFEIGFQIKGSYCILDKLISEWHNGLSFPAGCNRNYTGVQGRILMQTMPSECTLMIQAPANFTIALYFLSFYIQQSEQCLESSLEVGAMQCTDS